MGTWKTISLSLLLLVISACGGKTGATGQFQSVQAKSNPTPPAPSPSPLPQAQNEVPAPAPSPAEDHPEVTDPYTAPPEVPLANSAYTEEQLLDQTPSGQTRDQAVGTYNSGHLEVPTNLLVREQSYKTRPPFRILYPSRQNFFGTSELVDTIEFLAHCLQSLMADAQLLVGDLSAAHGGHLGRHLSHQIGLDADIGYITKDMVRNPGFSSVLLKDGGTTLLLREQLNLFYFAVNTTQVDRIFVHPRIKAALCEEAKKMGAFEKGKENRLALETFRRLIKDVDHDNHFHLRLKCPKGNPRCLPMAEPENRTGC